MEEAGHNKKPCILCNTPFMRDVETGRAGVCTGHTNTQFSAQRKFIHLRGTETGDRQRRGEERSKGVGGGGGIFALEG